MSKSGKPMPVMVADILKRIRNQPAKPTSPSPKEAMGQVPAADEPVIEVECYKEISPTVAPATTTGDEASEMRGRSDENFEPSAGKKREESRK